MYVCVCVFRHDFLCMQREKLVLQRNKILRAVWWQCTRSGFQLLSHLSVAESGQVVLSSAFSFCPQRACVCAFLMRVHACMEMKRHTHTSPRQWWVCPFWLWCECGRAYGMFLQETALFLWALHHLLLNLWVTWSRSKLSYGIYTINLHILYISRWVLILRF